MLLESGVDVNIKDATGLTPLELANNIDRDDLICMIKSEISMSNLKYKCIHQVLFKRIVYNKTAIHEQ